MTAYDDLLTDSQQEMDPRSLSLNNLHSAIEVLFQNMQVLMVPKCSNPWGLNQQEKTEGKKIKS